MENLESIYCNVIEKMQNAFAYHKLIVDENNEPVDYIFLAVNKAFEELTGLKRDKIIGKRVTEVIRGIDQAKFNWIKFYGKVALNGGEEQFEQYFEIWDRWYSVDVYSPEKGYFVTIFTDITNIKERESILKQTTENLEEIVILKDLKTKKAVYVNSAFERIYGITVDELIKNPNRWYEIVYPEDLAKVKKYVTAENALKKIEKYGVFTANFRIIDKKGKVRWIFTKYLPIRNDEGEIYRLVGIEQDVTRLKLFEEKLKREKKKAERLAKYDFLTGIYNRRSFFERVKIEMARSKRYQEKVAIIITDIDNFKKINDTYGHKAGDEVLKDFAKILRRMCREYDFVARFGGEEFVLFLNNVEEENAVKIAERIRNKIEKHSFYLSEKNIEIKLTASFGVAYLKSEDEYNVDEVLQRADKALYLAKKSGKNKVECL
ncbi:diguanylate cyclase [Carboxydothermus pertinax]|uniref:GGDEF domain-containing protein n=1 Tax=Carboxydothermus pertinax TaxID=870242 RepID=A0A1L8CS31_9THEO|nr:diguanylate cyclase [Carboxydothermus pertinax]GAV21723.1 GGDEF domain-containing protein [Carboxydothermus pertinax]